MWTLANMAKKIRISKKDSLLIIIGILFSFMVQSVYDAFREAMDINNFSHLVQFFLLLVVGLIFIVIFLFVRKNIEEV